ncbi:MAG: tRNA (adenosine(37)-N6)-threonylcarbamoyltransferase complex transferase subunit TsaD [Elusimicrobiota bacterium]
MIVLGIETSCDETAAALVQDGKKILSTSVSTQIKLHQPYSGVVPELASRSHVLLVNRVIAEVIKGVPFKKIDAIAVTIGPGLMGSLLVGKMTAETLGYITGKPVIGVNHIEGHLISALLENESLKPPFLGLVVSGGHTELIYAKSWGEYYLIGKTRDDAAGEAFDKVAKMLKLGYPGGPIIDRLAKQGDPSKETFPRAWLPGTWDFSFSGLKTAVLYRLDDGRKLTKVRLSNLAASFQESVVDVLTEKTIQAARALKVKTIAVGGGVAANSALRKSLKDKAFSHNFKLFMASPTLCTDNAAMIASVGYFKFRSKKLMKMNSLKVQPQMHIRSYTGKLKSFKI